MYGQIPTRGNPTQSRGGSGKQAISGSGNFGTSADRARASRLDPHGMLNASGTSDAAVPARYRSRVEQYFQRIAEETGGK